MTPTVLVPPVAEPVTLADAKAWLRLDTADEDALVTALIAAARELVQRTTRRALVAQTWRLTLDRWPEPDRNKGALAGCVACPLSAAPLSSIAAIRVYAADGSAQVLDSSTYRLVGVPDEARLVFSTAPPTPGRSGDGIQIDAVVGYGAPTDVPPALRQAVLATVAYLFENRGDGTAPDVAAHLSVAALVAPFRRPRLT